jgi:hypothetical protein
MLLEKKLFGLRLSPTEIADIVERHVGAGNDPAQYTEARAALKRMRTSAGNVYVRYALRPLDEAIDDRTAVCRAIATLRTWRHLSGA